MNRNVDQRNTDPRRRQLLLRAFAALGTGVLAGCDKLIQTTWFPKMLKSGETLSQNVHHLLGGRRSMAQEFSESDLSPSFRGNGNTNPKDPAYQAFAAASFNDWVLAVDGLVQQPARLSLVQLKAMPARTQITRHDCVEGWSAIGKWTGAPMSAVLDLVKPTAEARYVVFHCADSFSGNDDSPIHYYESIDMDDAYHIQTILAYGLNGQPLPVTNGAPLRLRVERQLGYKHAKYLQRIEITNSFAAIAGGRGGYWEDRGYEWYAGI